MFFLPTEVHHTIELLNRAGFEAYLVGGSVRDLCHGTTPSDYDITTSATPTEIKEVFKGERLLEVGIAHGTITLLCSESPLEITTYRTETSYSDHRHPDAVAFTCNLTDDLSRRDFTVNAMAYHPYEGLIDPFGGKQDLQHRLLRAVGEPDRRFTEDALRILRGLRFAATLGFSLEEKTANAMRKNSPLLSKISAERQMEEVKKFLLGQAVEPILSKYFSLLFPVFEPLKKAEENPSFPPLIARTVSLLPVDFPLRLAALLSFFCDTPNIAASLCQSKKADRHTTDRVVTLVAHQCDAVPPNEIAVKKAISSLGFSAFYDQTALQIARSSAAGNHSRAAAWQAAAQTAQLLEEQGDCLFVRDLAITGKDLLQYGVPEGPSVGRILSFLLTAVMENKVENKKEPLISLFLQKRIEIL